MTKTKFTKDQIETLWISGICIEDEGNVEYTSIMIRNEKDKYYFNVPEAKKGDIVQSCRYIEGLKVTFDSDWKIVGSIYKEID